MQEMIKLFIAVFLFSAVSGGVLATVNKGTEDTIKEQELKFEIGPTIKSIFESAENDPLKDLFVLNDGDDELDFFVGEFDGKRNSVAFEVKGTGFGGDVGIIVAVNVDSDVIVGVGVTTHSETPGFGARAKDEPDFCAQFAGMSLIEPFSVKGDGGEIDAISGATVTSRGICGILSEATSVYGRLKDEIKIPEIYDRALGYIEKGCEVQGLNEIPEKVLEQLEILKQDQFGETKISEDLVRLAEELPEPKVLITDIYIVDRFPWLKDKFESVEFNL